MKINGELILIILMNVITGGYGLAQEEMVGEVINNARNI